MADILMEQFFFRIEIITNEIDKIVRFAQCFPIGHAAWKRYRNHPIRPLLKYLDLRRIWSSIEYDNSDLSLGDSNEQHQTLNEYEARSEGHVRNEGEVPGKRRRSASAEETEQIPPSAQMKRVCIYEVTAEPEVFEDALESQVSK